MFHEKSLSEKIALYEELHGPVKSPTDFVDFCVCMGRQSGKTTKLIESIPAGENVMIVSWNYAHGNEIRHKIGEMRPDINLKQIFSASHSDKEMHDKIARFVEIYGFMNIYVDNAVLDMVAFEYVRDLNKVYGKYDDKK